MSSGGIDVSEEDKRLHREAEKSLKEVRQVPVPSTAPSYTARRPRRKWPAKSRYSLAVHASRVR